MFYHQITEWQCGGSARRAEVALSPAAAAARLFLSAACERNASGLLICLISLVQGYFASTGPYNTINYLVMIRFTRMRQQSAAYGERRAAGVRATAATTHSTHSTPLSHTSPPPLLLTQSILTSDSVRGCCCPQLLARRSLLTVGSLEAGTCSWRSFLVIAGLSGSTTQSREGGRVARVGRSSQFSPWGSNWCAWRSGSVRPRRWPAGTGGRRRRGAARGACAPALNEMTHTGHRLTSREDTDTPLQQFMQ
ncbi:unnamed protein product [Chrysodeixis includens]|uniref:Uncharacterized protein n=1 Tax=Chrysodeixis includens TaxID=689277 RepID=A0A9N8KW01_CHRIL|nr:unnamed protein product [Chrysodeixis includens]